MANLILKEPAPKVEILTHLNRSYIYINFPSSNLTKNDIYKIRVYVTEYGKTPDGELDEDNILSELLTEFIPARINYAKNSSGIPNHHLYYDINNSWYIFRFEYMYQPNTTIDGSAIFYSDQSQLIINNNTPIIYEGYISKFITGQIATVIRQTNNIFLNYEGDSTPEVNQLIKLTEPNIFIITELFDNEEFIILPIESSFLEFLLALFRDELFYNMVLIFYGVETSDDLPEDSELPILFWYNKEQCFFNIKGNIKNLINDYKK